MADVSHLLFNVPSNVRVPICISQLTFVRVAAIKEICLWAIDVTTVDASETKLTVPVATAIFITATRVFQCVPDASFQCHGPREADWDEDFVLKIVIILLVFNRNKLVICLFMQLMN